MPDSEVTTSVDGVTTVVTEIPPNDTLEELIEENIEGENEWQNEVTKTLATMITVLEAVKTELQSFQTIPANLTELIQSQQRMIVEQNLAMLETIQSLLTPQAQPQPEIVEPEPEPEPEPVNVAVVDPVPKISQEAPVRRKRRLI